MPMLRPRAAFGAACKEVTMGHSIYLADEERSIQELLHSFLLCDYILAWISKAKQIRKRKVLGIDGCAD